MSANPRSKEWVGRREGIGIEDYHRTAPGVSKSDLDGAHRSIAHYLAGKTQARKPTPAMAFGEAFHCRVLEPARFEVSYAAAPRADLRTKAGKATHAEWEQASAGKTPISAESMILIGAMYDSLMSHPIAGQLFVGGAAENTFFWVDEATGLLCKCRPDYLRPDAIVVDLKTAADASFSGFQRAIGNYRYHVQAPYYEDGIEAVIKIPVEGFLFVVIESEPPHAIAVYTLDEFSRERGRETYHEDLRRIAEYQKNPQAFVGYDPSIQEIFLPPWAS